MRPPAGASPPRGASACSACKLSERAALARWAGALGQGEAALACLGETTYDVYLNDVAFWRNVPARVWDYRLGGYQVMKKWLYLPRKGPAGPRAEVGGGERGHQHGPPHRRVAPPRPRP